MVFTNIFKAVLFVICTIYFNAQSTGSLEIGQKQQISLGGKTFLFNQRRALSHGAIQLAVLPLGVAIFAGTIY